MNRKKILIILLLVVNISINTVFAVALTENKTYEAPLSRSITLKRIQENYGYSSNRIYILEADMSDSNNKIDVLFNKTGISNRMSMLHEFAGEPGLVGALNADFFLMTTASSSIGTLVKDKKVMSSPAEAYNKFANIIVTDNGKVTFEHIGGGVLVDNITKNSTQNIQIMNKQIGPNFMGNAILSTDFAYSTPGKNYANPNRVEIIVSPEGVVTEVRENMPGVKIPYGGYAVVSYRTTGSDLKQIYSVGDKLNVTLNILKNRPDVNTIIGGGTILIKDGQKTPLTNIIPGKAQRSAVAVTNDGKFLMIANDGRLPLTAGFDEKDMQNFLYNLGVKDAMILDGGGSTELIADGKMQNYQAGERKVINAVTLKNMNQTGMIDKIHVTPLDDIIYVGDEVDVVASAQDTSGAKNTSYNSKDFMIRSEGFSSTSAKAGKIVPTSAGSGRITASVGGVTGYADVTVLESHGPDIRNKAGKVPKINIYQNMNDTSSLISSVIKSKIVDNSQAGDTNLIIGNTDDNFTKSLNGQNVISNIGSPLKMLQDTVIVSINSAEPLYKNETQVQNLDNALNSPAKNVIIAMQSGYKVGILEQDAFDKKLENAAKNKNIYLIYKSDKYDAYKRGNVSYISFVDLKNNSYNNLSNVKYLQMYEGDSGELTYAFKSVID